MLTTPTPSFGLDGNGPEIARAIDQAVADGMDVLNLSLGEPEVESANDLVARAIHGAARAGVVTVVAAGNSGDDLGGGSVSSPGSAPDAITVAATSVGRFVGVSVGVLGPGAVPADLAAFGAASNDADEIPSAWNAGVPLTAPGDCGGGRAGALVLVQLGPQLHGARAPRRRSRPARSASSSPSTRPAIRSRSTTASMRTLTVSDLVGARLAQQAAAAGGELTLSVDDHETKQISANSGLIASFSSRGPAPYSLALKPDVSAPGVDIVSPIPGGYGTWSGTSMASPAVAGAAALLRQRHPTWTPAQIKSALVLTARPVFNDTAHKHPTSVLAAGGGMIDVQAADAPGLFAEPSGVSFGLVRPAHSETRSIELSDAGGGGGVWSVSAPGLDVAASVGRARRRLAEARALAAPAAAHVGGQPLGQHRAHVRDAHASTSAGGATSSARGSPSRPRASSRPAAGSRATRARAPSSCSTTAGPRAPAAAGCRASIPGASSCGRSPSRPGARNAGVVAEGAVVPQILLARDENRLAGEPALPSNGNPVPRDLRPVRARERPARAGPGPLLRHRRDASGPHARAPIACGSGSTTARRPRSSAVTRYVSRRRCCASA